LSFRPKNKAFRPDFLIVANNPLTYLLVKLLSMEEIIIADKEKYLLKNYPFRPIPKLTAKRRCIHCNKDIIVGDFKVFRDKNGEEFICCPNAPECDGTVLQWFRKNL
jgi:hypothetical protein